MPQNHNTICTRPTRPRTLKRREPGSPLGGPSSNYTTLASSTALLTSHGLTEQQEKGKIEREQHKLSCLLLLLGRRKILHATHDDHFRNTAEPIALGDPDQDSLGFTLGQPGTAAIYLLHTTTVFLFFVGSPRDVVCYFAS